MALLTLWPTLVNDTGDFQSGSIANVAMFNDIKAAIEDHTHSTTNTTRKPKDTTDEMVAARGSQPSLGARLDVSLNADGTLITPASLATQAQLQSAIGKLNLLGNDTFVIWPASTVAAYWTFAGAGGVFARAGTGEADTVRRVGRYCLSANRVGTDLTATQVVLDAAAYPDFDNLDGLTIGFGCWVRSAVATHARIQVQDGASTTNSSYHTGAVGWEWLSLTHVVSASATKLEAILEVKNSNGTAYFAGPTMIVNTLAPTNWIPCPVAYGVMHFPIIGNAAVATKKFIFAPRRPMIIKDVQIRAETAPTGAALILDVNTNTNAVANPTFASMFSTRPQIAISDFNGGAQPDGTYERRCMQSFYGVTPAIGSVLSVDVDQIGSTVAGADIVIEIGALQYMRPLESGLAFND